MKKVHHYISKLHLVESTKKCSAEHTQKKSGANFTPFCILGEPPSPNSIVSVWSQGGLGGKLSCRCAARRVTQRKKREKKARVERLPSVNVGRIKTGSCLEGLDADEAEEDDDDV